MTMRKVEFAASNVETVKEGREYVDVNALLMYSGEFVDAEGQRIKVKSELLRSLAHNYAAYLAEPMPGENAIKKLFGVRPERLYRPVSLNHEKDDVCKIVGRVMALEVQEHEGDTYLFGRMRISHEDSMRAVANGLFTNVSISFDYDEQLDEGSLIEISYVFDGAVTGARSFAKPANVIAATASIEDMPRSTYNMAMQRTLMDMAAKRREVKKIEVQLKRTRDMKSACVGLDTMVKDGLISRADMKRLMIDVKSIDLAKYPVYLRAVKTVAMSKKQARGQVSSNWQMTAFESFIDSMVENGGSMKKGMNPKEFAKQAAAQINKLMNKGAASTDTTQAKMSHLDIPNMEVGLPHEQKHIEDDHMVRFTKEDMERMALLAHEGRKDELLSFMGECSGMEFAYDDKAEDNDSAEHKMGAEDEDAEEEHREKEEGEESRDHSAHDYKKFMAHLDAKMLEFGKQIKGFDASINELNDTLIKMAGNRDSAEVLPEAGDK